jgi:ornithine cyclodeaminase/alanine dehydrogenase
MTLLLRDEAVRQCSDMTAIVKGLEAAFVAEGNGGSLVMPPRQNLAFEDSFLRVMPVIMGGVGVFGLKMFHGSIKRGVRYVVLLCDLETADVIAIVDGAYLTAVRTGATSALATRRLARPDSTSVGVIGSGLEAETNLAATCTVLDVERVKVFSPRQEHRTRFAERMSSTFGFEAVAVDHPQEAVAGVDMVVVATNTGPNGVIAYSGDWLEPGQHVSSIGSTTPVLREIDEATFERSDRIVYDVTPDVMMEESGDVHAFAERNPDRHGSVLTLQTLLAEPCSPSRAPDAVTLYKSVGAAVQDVACALAIYENARQLGLGDEVDSVAVLKSFE